MEEKAKKAKAKTTKTTKKTAVKTVVAKPAKKSPVARVHRVAKKAPEADLPPALELETAEMPVTLGEANEEKTARYFYAIGRRKTSTGIVRLYTRGTGEIMVNKQDYKKYFPTTHLEHMVEASLNEVGQRNNVNVQITVYGGGKIGQAGAASLGISRALLKLNPVFRRALRRHGFLTRDSREKERKKYGLRKARRAPQFSKR